MSISDFVTQLRLKIDGLERKMLDLQTQLKGLDSQHQEALDDLDTMQGIIAARLQEPPIGLPPV